MTTDDHIVFIVDDDARIREALGELLASHGMRAVAFGSAGDYVGAEKPDVPACLILDVELPDINGLDLQGQIAEGESSADRFHNRAWRHPVIGPGDQARRRGFPDQAFQRCGPHGRNPCGDRPGSGKADQRAPNLAC